MIKFISSFSGIAVTDITEARRFYVDVLGLSIKNEDMGMSLELPGGGELFVYQKYNHVPAEFTILNLAVENINSAIDELVYDHGITFERYEGMPVPQDERGILRGKAAHQGPDIAWFKDPAGNILSIIEA